MTGAERRRQLLDVGRELFAQKGFEATSIEEIAAHADVSKPVVYEHFGGKDGLYALVVDREMQSLLGQFSAALSHPGSPRDLLERAALANDLQEPALSLRPELRRALRTATGSGAAAALVSGSGPTVAALVQDEAAAVRLAAQLAGEGIFRTVRAVHGPVPGARLLS